MDTKIYVADAITSALLTDFSDMEASIVSERLLKYTDSIEQSAIIEAKHYVELVNTPVIVMKTRLCVNILRNQPGLIDSAVNTETEDTNIEKLLGYLIKDHNRTASYETVAVYIDTDGNIKTAYGICNGSISWEQSKYFNTEVYKRSLPYASIFRPHNHTRCISNLDIEELNKIDSRVIAIKNLLKQL